PDRPAAPRRHLPRRRRCSGCIHFHGPAPRPPRESARRFPPHRRVRLHRKLPPHSLGRRWNSATAREPNDLTWIGTPWYPWAHDDRGPSGSALRRRGDDAGPEEESRRQRLLVLELPAQLEGEPEPGRSGARGKGPRADRRKPVGVLA